MSLPIHNIDSIQDGFDQDMDGVDGSTVTEATGGLLLCIDSRGELLVAVTIHMRKFQMPQKEPFSKYL